jgi:hypothetical protein
MLTSRPAGAVEGGVEAGEMGRVWLDRGDGADAGAAQRSISAG